MRVLLMPLTPSQHKRLVRLVASYCDTIERRRGLLEDAGLANFVAEVALNATATGFAEQLISVLQRHGKLAATDAPALRTLLLELRERVQGRRHDLEFVQELLDLPPVLAIPPPLDNVPTVRFTHSQRLIGGSVGLVLLLSAILVIVQTFAPSPPPVVPMPPGFNVLVVGFGAIDMDGNSVRSPDGLEVAELFAGRLSRGIDAYLGDAPDPPHVRFVAETDLLNTTDPQRRAEIVIRLEKEHNANLVVYGVIALQATGGLASFHPIFYTDYRGAAREKDLIEGENALGTPFFVPIPFNAAAMQGIENTELDVRPQALTLLIMGLSFDTRNNYERALHYYDKALALSGWDRRKGGVEIGYLLAGNAASQWATLQEQRSELYYRLLQRAEAYYAHALEVNPHYGRAMVGLHGIHYLRGIDFIETGDRQAAIQVLEEAVALLDKAALPENATPGANLSTKAHFGKGQALLLMYYLFEEDPQFLGQAQAEFEAVLAFYSNTNDINKGRLQEYAANAHARLGFIARRQSQLDMAADAYSRAAELASPYFQGQYLCIRGQILLAQGFQDEAKHSLLEASAILQFNNLAAPEDCTILERQTGQPLTP